MNKKKILYLVLIITIFIAVIYMSFVNFISPILNKNNGDDNIIEIVQLDTQSKLETGDYLILTNALYFKAIENAKELNQSISLFEQKSLTEIEFSNMISNLNKRLTYYYLVAIQNPATEHVENVETHINYDFYLMRRASEELLKYLSDRSTLRLSVGSDLLKQAIERETETLTIMSTAIAKYDINPNTVVVDDTIWDKEYEFVSQIADTVIFKDLNSSEMSEYAYYLQYVNESFMLVSWEVQNMYISRIDFEQEEISSEQLKANLESSGFTINNAYDELYTLNAPEGLENLEKDTRKTITLYRDALLEIQKYIMTKEIEHFDNAMAIITQADVEAGRIGEFIYSVRSQYGF